jgi:hypothetical protein
VTSVINYDNIQGFIDYINKEEWKKYIENYVIPVWSNASVLRNFFEIVKTSFQGVFLKDVNQRDLPLILGGIVPSNERVYKKNSLAKFYNKFFGLKIDDLQSWIAGSELAGIQPKVTVEKTAFMEFVEKVFEYSDIAIKNQTVIEPPSEPEVNYDELKYDVKKLIAIIENFYQSVLNISVNYNYGTFFLWSIKQIPYKFMKEAYPRIDQIIDFLQTEFGLEPLRWKMPFTQDSSLYKDYTIWCWPEYNTSSKDGGYCGPEYSKGKSFGGSICILNEVIWKYLTSFTELEKIFSEYFSIFPNLKKEYMDIVKNIITTKFHNYIYYKGIAAAESASELGETNLTLMQMIDEVSPYLFTGLAKIDYVCDSYIRIWRI